MDSKATGDERCEWPVPLQELRQGSKCLKSLWPMAKAWPEHSEWGAQGERQSSLGGEVRYAGWRVEGEARDFACDVHLRGWMTGKPSSEGFKAGALKEDFELKRWRRELPASDTGAL